MTLKEAIEILDQLPYQGEGCLDGKTIAALKLSIEAGKRLVECRLADYMIRDDLLPGETEQ